MNFRSIKSVRFYHFFRESLLESVSQFAAKLMHVAPARRVIGSLLTWFCAINLFDIKMRVLYLFVFFLAAAYANKNTLVLLDSLTAKETHSIFFKSLSGKLKFTSSGFILRLYLSYFSFD